MVSASAAPYGYTITVWSSGAMLVHFRGFPAVWEVFLFVAGAVLAFAGLWLLGHNAIEHTTQVTQGEARVMAGALDMFAVGAAVGAGTLIAMIPSAAAWPLASLCVTAVYIILASLQLAFSERQVHAATPPANASDCDRLGPGTPSRADRSSRA